MSTDLYNIYAGSPIKAESGTMTTGEKDRVEFYRSRFETMREAKQNQTSKFRMIDLLYDAFDDKVMKGHTFGERVRFPKAWAAVERKEAEFVDFIPEVRFNSIFEDKKDSALSANAVLKHFDNISNERFEDNRARHDTIKYGTGIKFIGWTTKKKFVVPTSDEYADDVLLKEAEKIEVTEYDGQAVERVNPKDFYIDEAAYVMYDQTGTNGARDCIWAKRYPYSTFLKQYNKAPYKNIDLVKPSSLGSSEFGEERDPSKHEQEDDRQSQRWVNVLLYVNEAEDMWCFVANGIEIFYGANPYKHKRLPFVAYHNYRRDDSFWGLSEVEIQATFIYVGETLLNLMIEDTMLAMQPTIAVDGNLQVPKEGLRPGGVMKWRGQAGGKLKDSIMPLRFGGLDQSASVLKQVLEDEMIASTGDDIRALFISPDELATRTLTKRESRLKRIRKTVYENTVDAKRSEALMKLSNIVQFGAKPVQGIDGKVHYRRLKIEGSDVHQEKEDTEPHFEQRYGANGYFYLNSKTLHPEFVELETIPMQEDELMRKDELEAMMQFLSTYSTILQVAQADPAQAQRLLDEIDLVGLVKQVTKRFSNFDEETVFPVQAKIEHGRDMIDFEHEAIMFDFNPPIKPDEDSEYHLERHQNLFAELQDRLLKAKKPEEKELITAAIKTLTLHINDTIKAIRDRVISKVTPAQTSQPMADGVPPSGPEQPAAGANVAQPNQNDAQAGVSKLAGVPPRLAEQGVGGAVARRREDILYQRAALRAGVGA